MIRMGEMQYNKSLISEIIISGFPVVSSAGGKLSIHLIVSGEDRLLFFCPALIRQIGAGPGILVSSTVVIQKN